MRADFPEILLEHALPDLIFALLFADVPFWGSVKIDGLAYSIMVVQLILVQFVLVRIQVGQQETRDLRRGFCFWGSGRTRSPKRTNENASSTTWYGGAWAPAGIRLVKIEQAFKSVAAILRRLDRSGRPRSKQTACCLISLLFFCSVGRLKLFSVILKRYGTNLIL